MKFSEYRYERPDYEKTKEEMSKIIEKMDKCNNFKEFRECITDINKIRNHIETVKTMASLNYSINTDDENNIKEKEYWDINSPIYDSLNMEFYKALKKSDYREEIIEEYGNQFFRIADFSLREFSDEIIEDLQEENRLCSEYTKLLSNGRVEFDGKINNLSQMGKYMLSSDREIRKEASKSFYDYFDKNEKKFDDNFDALVKVRDKIAKKLGFDDFVELGYIRMRRSDYNEEMVKNLREAVAKYWPELIEKLYKIKKERLNIEDVKYFDDDTEFPGWEMEPETDYDETVEAARKMYHEISKETGEFFDYITENEFMDLESKEGKGMGGYCTYLPEIKAPFIFANFNRTFDDVDTLTHEAGHAFQLYMSKWIDMPEINFPTLDTCEIHSMSMEFITMPWMNLFFGKNTGRFEFSHLATMRKLIPYCMIVDEFQHIIYRKPDLTPEERKNEWHKLEKKYTPYKDYDGVEILEKGCWWFKQGHIFKNPFYYIDYALAEICALQIADNIEEDRRKGWDRYLDICRVGGTKSFMDVVALSGIQSPFESSCIRDISVKISLRFDKIERKYKI